SEFEYGFQYKRIRTDTSDKDRLWTVGRVCLWPNGLFTGNHVEFRVPVDDENTLSVMWHFSRVPREREPYVQNSIPTWQGPIADPATGRWTTSHVMNQDVVTWVGQGRIADRSQEYLAPSDRGIVLPCGPGTVFDCCGFSEGSCAMIACMPRGASHISVHDATRPRRFSRPHGLGPRRARAPARDQRLAAG